MAVLSANPASNHGVFLNYDFSTSADKAFGTDVQKDLGNDSFGMIGGDANADGVVDNFDVLDTWIDQVGLTG